MKILEYKTLLFILLIMSSLHVNAQNQEIRGLVSSDDGSPLIGATVIVKGTHNGTITDINGNYTLKDVPEDAILIFSFLGFKTIEDVVGSRTEMNITLMADPDVLEEVVVIGYGEVKKSDLTGAVSSVKSDQLSKTTGTSIESTLQGRVAGVKVTTSEGGPGSGISISVRGNSSINGNSQPLYVIDGVPILKEDLGGNTTSLVSSMPADPLSGINPGDIASIEVLKDASATAIYGSRGANGVVIITTKSGKSGEVKINYDTYYGVSTITKKLDLMNTQEYYLYQYVSNPGQEIFTLDTRRDYTLPSQITSLENQVDWQDEVYRTAKLQSHQVGFRGGSEQVKYYASIGYFDQEGIIVGSDFKRYSGLLNIDVDKNKFRMHSNLNFSQSLMQGSVYASEGPTGNFGGTVSRILNARPVGSPESVNPTAIPDSGTDEENDYLLNPYIYATAVTNDNTINRITGNINAFYDLTDHFTIQSRIGGNANYTTRESYFPQNTTVGRNVGGQAEISKTDAQRFFFENLLRYSNNWGDHNLNSLVGFTMEKGIRKELNVISQGFAYDHTGVDDIALGTVLSPPVNSYQENTLQSVLARFSYDYDRKYFLTINGRLDGSSRFPKSNRYSIFPSGALAWNVHKENFMDNVQPVSRLKLRYSLGTSGNQAIASYESQAFLDNVTYSFGGGSQAGLVYSQLANNRLKWETTVQHNLGVDLGVFKNAVEITVEAYKKNVKDVLVRLPVSDVLGLNDNPYQNIGEIQNLGVEFSIDTRNIESKNFEWNTNLNFSITKNEIVSLGSIDQFFVSLGNRPEYRNLVTYRTGGEIGEFWGYKTDGIIKTQEEFDALPDYTNKQIGGWKLVDTNNDNVIDDNDRTLIGSNQPDFFGGITNNFRYKNFDLSFFFDFSFGQQVYNGNRVNLENTRNTTNKTGNVLKNSFQAEAVLDELGNEIFAANLNGTLPSLGSTPLESAVDAYVEDASYIRLQNITLGYNVPLKKSQLRVYLAGNSLLTFSDYKGYNPDVNNTYAGGLIRGVDNGAYPGNRNFIAGLNVSF